MFGILVHAFFMSSLIPGEVQILTGRSGARPGGIQGEVLDFFDDKRVLISFGSFQGATKGMTVYLDRLQTSSLSHHKFGVPVAELELLAVAARHSVAQVKWRSPGMKIEIGDFAWVPYSRRRSMLSPLPELPRVPGVWERGGAIIDLTAPKQQK